MNMGNKKGYSYSSRKRIGTKIIIGLMTTMMFVNSNIQTQVKAANNIDAQEWRFLLRSESDRETRNYLHDELQKNRKAVSTAEAMNYSISNQEEIIDLSANNSTILTNLLSTGEISSIPTRVMTENQSFVVEDGSAVYNTVLELMEFYVGADSIEKIMDSEQPMESLTEAGTQVTRVKVSGMNLDLSLTTGEETLTAEQARRMFLYGQTEPAQTITFDEESSLYYIAKDYNLTEEELVLLNPELKDAKWDDLIGMELDVTPLNPLFTIETETEQAYLSPVAYETEIIEDSTMLDGHEEVLQAGQKGEVLTRITTTFDGTEIIEEIQNDEAINEVVIRGTKVVNGVGTGEWAWPTTVQIITNDYLSYDGNYGIDITADSEQDVYASDSGIISEMTENSILVDHNNGYYSRYSNLNSTTVSLGEEVESGQNIGTVGTTTEDSYLHFEIRTNTNSQQTYAPNPLVFL